MAQLLRFVDLPSGTVLLDVSPGVAGIQVGPGGLDAPPPPVRRSVADNPVVDGGVVASASYGLRTVTLPLVYTTGTVASLATQAANRRAAVTAAMRVLQQERTWLEVRPDGATESRFLWLHRPDTEALTRLQGLGDRWAEVTLQFLAEPFALGPVESVGTLSTTVAGDLQTSIAGAGIKGDVPAPLVCTITSAGGLEGPKPRSLWVGSKVGGTAHKALQDVGPFAVGTLPGASTNTTVASGTAVGGSVRRWANVSAGQEWVAATGLLFTTPGGGNDAKLAGSYRVLVFYGSVGFTEGDTWEAELRLVTPGTWTFMATEQRVGRVAQWVESGAVPASRVQDLGVVEFPFAGRPLAPSFEAPAAMAPASLKLYFRHPTGSGGAGVGVDIDALVFVPADDTLMVLQYADAGTARTFTVDPYTGQVVVQQGGVAVSDTPRVQAQGSPPYVVPGVDVGLVAFTTYGGLGQAPPQPSTGILPASFTGKYWPRYLTVA